MRKFVSVERCCLFLAINTSFQVGLTLLIDLFAKNKKNSAIQLEISIVFERFCLLPSSFR